MFWKPAGVLSIHVCADAIIVSVDWTGRSLAKGKRGKIPPELRPLVENLHPETERRVETVVRYSGLFRRVAGSAESLGWKAIAMGQQWLAGVPANRHVLRSEQAVA